MRLFPEWPWRRRREKILSANGRSVVSGCTLVGLLAAVMREAEGWLGITGSGLLMLLCAVGAAGAAVALGNRALGRLLFAEGRLPSDKVAITVGTSLLFGLSAVAFGFELSVRLAGGDHF